VHASPPVDDFLIFEVTTNEETSCAIFVPKSRRKLFLNEQRVLRRMHFIFYIFFGIGAFAEIWTAEVL
jgi:hypothetical protein